MPNASIDRLLVSRISLMRDNASDEAVIRLGEIEKASGFRTGERYSLEGRSIHHVTVDMESREFFMSKDGEQPLPLTQEMFERTSGLCYWSR
jgi:hypothetical protein